MARYESAAARRIAMIMSLPSARCTVETLYNLRSDAIVVLPVRLALGDTRRANGEHVAEGQVAICLMWY